MLSGPIIRDEFAPAGSYLRGNTSLGEDIMLTRFVGTMALLIGIADFSTGGVPSGRIRGSVIDQKTREPLAGVAISIAGTVIGSSSDADGKYQLAAVPVGVHSVRFGLVGYDAVVLTDVLVSPDRTTTLDAGLREAPVRVDEVTAMAGYFPATDVVALGSVGFNAEEIRRSPGSANDVSRVLLSLPSTAKVADNANDLAVRGGSPVENGFYVDGIQIPNINHFPVQGSTGGPIGLLNIDFIDNVEFLPSGFSAAYGDRLSSVVDIGFRDGNAETFCGKAFVGFAGFGGTGEGPLPAGTGSWMVSVNKSYLDLLVDAIGTGVAPRYGDIQGKATLDLGRGHTLTLLDVWGRSTIDFDKATSIENGERYYGSNANAQHSLGARWQALWGAGYYSTTTASLSHNDFSVDFSKVNSDLTALRSDNSEAGITVRSVHFLVLDDANRLEAGIEGKYNRGVFDYVRSGDTNHLGAVDPDYRVAKTINAVHGGISGTYVWTPTQHFSVSMGVRVDHFGLNSETTVSPRLAVSFSPSPPLTLSVKTGIFTQQIPLVALSGDDRFQELPVMKAYHLGLGIEYLLRPDTKLTVEFYDKEYDRLPVDPSDPTLTVVDGGLFSQRFGNYRDLKSTGKAYTRGVEVLLQKRMAQGVYGLVSGSYFRSRYSDNQGVWRDRIYDNRFIFSVIGGYRPEGEWEFSARWTYAGGGPFTPYDETASTQANTGILDLSRIASERYPAYHALNIRVDRKFYFEKHLLDVYLSVWNVYNRQNVAGYFWNTTENHMGTREQWGMLPVLGVEYEF